MYTHTISSPLHVNSNNTLPVPPDLAMQLVAPQALTPPRPRIVKGLPVVGSLPALLRNAPRALLDVALSHPGEVVSLRLGPTEVPLVTDPEHVQEVLVEKAREFTKAGMWEATRPLLGHGLVTSDGDFWRRQRRLVQPLFTQKHLGNMAGVMVKAIQTQLGILARKSRGGVVVDVGTEMAQLTQRVLMDTIFGASLSEDLAQELGRQLAVGFKMMNYRIFLYFLPEWIPRPGGRAFFNAVNALDQAMLGLLAERRAHPSDGLDILNQLIAARDADTGEVMSDRQIRDELMTLFAAGLDTTAVTLTWVLSLLARHPHVEARLRSEVGEVLGDRTPTLTDLTRLSYTRQVIQEAMRLYPPAWIFPRYTAEGTVVGGRTLAPGTSLLVSPYVTHHHPALWQNPEVFDPDRFSPEQSAQRPKMAYYPFGGGPRQCLGNHFAVMEAQLALALLVQHFQTELVPGQRIEPTSASTLNPRYGVKMSFRPA